MPTPLINRLVPNLGSPRHVQTTSRATLTTWFPARTVALHRVVGHADLPIATLIAAHLEEHMAMTKAPVTIFDDFDEVTGYDSDTRLRMTEWTRDNDSVVSGVHILFRSKLVAMGVSVANLALQGSIRSYDDGSKFYKALAAASAPSSLFPPAR